MADNNLQEINLEEAIEASLVNSGGYQKGNPTNFDRKLALDKETLLTFIKKTQPKAWKRYQTHYPVNPEECFISNLCKTIRDEGLLKVFRRQFQDRGIKFNLCYFKPESGLNEETINLYNQNVLHCTRQLHYSLSSENSIDIVLFLNGIPVVSMELKNQFTGQDVNNAISQYKFDRASKDTIFEFKNRVFVHFAVDLYNVYMTTRLQGSSTYFLPFNQGSNGTGNVGGKGNPANPDGFCTSYLWEKVLTKDSLLEIIQKYLHLQVQKDKYTGKTKEVMIFPRYHQLDVVSKLIADVKENGAGKNYLIQHSAGSGKSNSIAWLAHQLAGLHKTDDEKVFNSIIVLTDRKVLDTQLQDTIYQFDHVAGVVKKVKNGSKELLDAINSNTKVIISTLQKFPRIYKDIVSENKNFAIIVDEAHSSQSGKDAGTVIKGLANLEKALNEYAEIESRKESKKEDSEDLLIKTLASQGNHENLSFFAFTATPKAKTLNRFGEKQADGTYRAFHTYSMQQAIEEGFILDVLQNYTTYKTYYRLIKTVTDDPELESSKGAKAISRYETLHPHNIAQKTAIMIEHFNEITKNKIGGQAKAMVVTPSRLHAIRYLHEFRKYIETNDYKDINVLVAFSGELTDGGITYSETKLNKTADGENIKEIQLPDYFHNDFNILIVAEKYQTGFDEPLLHTMFVDKKLNDVKAVQTLSRLNRTTRGKTDTFVLDFVNEADEIKQSFQQYYQATILNEEIDPNQLYKLKSILDDMQVYQIQEIEHFADVYYKSKANMSDLGKLSGLLKPAIDRFKGLNEEEQEQFRTALNNYIKMYSFVVQVIRMFDADLEKLYVYARYLIKCIRREKGATVEVDDKLLLEYYRNEKTFEGQIHLENKDGETTPPKGGSGGGKKEKSPLSELIDKFNERFGTSFTGQDKVLSQIIEDMKLDDRLVEAGKEKNKTLFKGLYEQNFTEVMVSRYEQNDQFFKDLFQDEEKMEFMKKLMFTALYNNLRTSSKEKCKI